MHQLTALCLGMAAGASLFAKDLYVSPQGRDGNPGTREQPLASVQQALTALRDGGGGTVWLGGRGVRRRCRRGV
jgi:hypothetical protein